ncbi:MAG TPA: hypothetical protein VKA46_09040 [Gemmataceae bacterium]|nr:hypothetical protein [Gemmataceae bacterium]
MAQAALVEMQIKEGQTLIERLAHEEVAVTAAGWVKESESGDWYLYLATPLVGEDGPTRSAYRRVNAVIRKMQEEGFGMDPFEKKVIGPHDPIARDMLANRGGRPGGPPTPFRGSRLGDLDVEEAYIYPPLPNPEEQAGIELWECGRTELRPGIGPAGLCRVVVIDLENQAVLQKRTYRGTMANPQPLSPGQLEVTWAEGGAVRIIGSAAQQRWSWSQPRATWEEGGCPPDKVLHAILTAMG